MQFKEWLLNEIYWVSPPPDKLMGPNRIPVCVIHGIPVTTIDFHFEKYPDSVMSPDRSAISLISKNMLMQGASVSAPLGNGKFLNVLQKKVEEPEEVKNMTQQQWIQWRREQRARAAEGGVAVATEENPIQASIGEKKYMQLPLLWFKMAKFVVFDPVTQKSWTTKEHGATKATTGFLGVTFEPMKSPDIPTVEPVRPTPRPEPQFRVVHAQEGLKPLMPEDMATTAAEDGYDHMWRLWAKGHNPMKLGPPMTDEDFYKAYQPWRK